MKKPFLAVLIALLVTACLAAPMFAISGAALINKNGIPASDSPPGPPGSTEMSPAGQGDQVRQLQSLLAQYQDREQQYQQREQQLREQLTQANAQIQQDQRAFQQVQVLLEALQQKGLIQLTADGRILITQ